MTQKEITERLTEIEAWYNFAPAIEVDEADYIKWLISTVKGLQAKLDKHDEIIDRLDDIDSSIEYLKNMMR